jgi:hypothetical protein
MRKHIFIVALVMGAVMLAAALAIATRASATPGDPVQALKSVASRYNSFKQAEKAGYSVEGEPCVASPAGTMGIHAINRALVEDPAIDPLEPEILVYLPKGNGKLELVAVEYMRIAADQSPAGGFDESDKPSLFGRAFDGIMPAHAPWMGWHYDLHVWLWEDNPSGLLAPFNPALSC